MSLGPPTTTILRWTGIGFAAFVVLVVLVLSLLDWNLLKHPLERIATARSGRTVTISGPLEVHIWSWTPRFALSGLTVGNPPWEPARPMAKVEKLQVQLKLLPLLKGDVILPRVELIHPQLYLHRETSGRANWTFENTKPTNAPAGRPARLPVVRDFLIERGELTFVDEIIHLTVDGTLQAHEKSTKDDPKAFHLEGHGTLNKQPFSLQLLGGPLINLDPQRAYPFDLQIGAGDTRVESQGRFRKPFDLGQVSLDVSAKGQDLADLYYLTQLALPNTPPFTLHAALDRNGQLINVTQLAGTVGGSDLGGELKVDLSRKRPRISGTLVSKQLRLRDLAASLGTQRPAAATPAPAAATDRLFPEAHLQVERVRAMDGDIRFEGRSIEAGSVPMKQMALHIKLDDGVLSLDPVEFQMPQGLLRGTATIDARGKVPQTHLDVRMTHIELDQLKGKAPDATPPLGGELQARAVLDGHGDSVHALLADANGRLVVILPHGEVRAAFAELTGINIVNGLGLLMTGDKKRAQIRCGVAQFAVNKGAMQAQNFVFDTADVVIKGSGEIRLGPEELDLSIQGEPKKLRLARLKTPVKIGGHLLKPAIGVDAGKTLKQGAIATAIGAVVAPVAAILAFVDPGLAKDQNCSALLDTAHAENRAAVPADPSTARQP